MVQPPRDHHARAKRQEQRRGRNALSGSSTLHWKCTGVPGFTSAATRAASQLVSRTQPCDSVCPDVRRLRRAVHAVVLEAERDPHHPDRVVGTGFDRRLRVSGLRVPKQIWVVVKDRIPAHSGHLEIARRQGVVLAARRHWSEEHHRTVCTRRSQRRLVARHMDRDVARGRVARRLHLRIERRHARHSNLAARGYRHARIQLLDQRRRGVKSLAIASTMDW